MKANVIGKKSRRVERRGVELTHAEAVKLSAMAEVVVFGIEETPNGMHLMYNDGVMREYDPVTNTIVGAFAERHAHGGWVG